MGQKKMLSEDEKAKIAVLAQVNPDWTKKQIADVIGRSPQTIARFLKSPETYKSKISSGRPKVTTDRDDRKIARQASNDKISAIAIHGTLESQCSLRTVQRRLQQNKNLKFCKHNAKPMLSANHKLCRLEFAKLHVTWRMDDWSKIIWSDEKKFNLDGPDAYRFYWHDLRKEKQIFAKRNCGGGSVMVWAAFGINGCTPLAFCKTKMTSCDYQDILAEYLLPEAPLISPGEYIFMHDNAPIHRSNSTKDWLEANGVETMQWPALSPDLNPIENLWGWLSRKVYSQGRQFHSVSDLKRGILNAWSEIPDELIKKLFNSMNDRMIKVIQARGSSIDY